MERKNAVSGHREDLRRPAFRALIATNLLAWCPAGAAAGEHAAPPLTVTRPAPVPPPIPPQIPPPQAVTPGYPLTTFESSITDGATRFITPGPAEARCPGQPVVFVFGVINPLRPTLPGDGAFMCRSDAVAEGYLSR